MVNILLGIFVLWLLGQIIGVIAGMLITLLKTESIKTKVIILIIVVSVIYAFIVIFGFQAVFKINYYLFIALFMAILGKEIIFGSQKFLLRLEVASDGTVSIFYLNLLLRIKRITFPPDSDNHLILSEMRSLVHLPPSLTLKSKDVEARYIILSKKLWTSTGDLLRGANIGFSS